MKLRAKDVMKDKLVVARLDMTLFELRDLLSTNQVTGCPVVDDEGHLVGVVSQTDLVRSALKGSLTEFADDDVLLGGSSSLHASDSDSFVKKLTNATVREVMDPNVYSVSAEEGVQKIASIMRGNRIHRVIVRDQEKPVGVISALDLLKVVEESE